MKNYIKNKPIVYEHWKSMIRRYLPLSENAKVSLSDFASGLHQRYVEDFVFIHINKCGGTSMERSLGIPLLNHDTAVERRLRLGQNRWENRFKFALVRNPYDRIASLYFYRNRNNNKNYALLASEFPDWLANIATRNTSGVASKYEKPQTAWVTNSNGEFILDKIFRLEELINHINELEHHLNRKLHLNKIKANPTSRPYNELYTAETKLLVNNTFESDFESFGYEK